MDNCATVSIQDLQAAINEQWCITWTGFLDEDALLIKLRRAESTKYVTFDIQTLPKVVNPKVIKHCEATSEPFSFVGVTWQKRGWLRSLRIASIYGINIASTCKPGLGNLPTTMYTSCTMGYDIETSQTLVRNHGFPPLCSPITSIAIWCKCGYNEAWSTISHKKIEGLTYCATSANLVRLSVNAIKQHQPEWLVGYNCYQFDNCVMSYHCPKDMTSMFRAINSGQKSTSRHSFYIDIPGVNNVDLYAYLDKCLRRQYSALSLGTVAQHHKLTGKMQMPNTDSTETIYDLIRYNMNDSIITAKLWSLTGAEEQVVGLCVASCSPLVDCIRYVTGTMSSCAVSSYCISNNMLMDWSECNLRIGYEGGTVLEPQKSIFRKVTVCDFSAMYPTIIKDIGISPENIEILANCSKKHDDKLIWWNERCTIVCIKGKVIKYTTHNKCMTRDVLEFVTQLRNKYKKSNVPYSTALKVLANSLYGALGYASSPLHSPRCAATVTVAGRTALALGYTVFSKLGLTVVYGDTDSCFLASGSKTDSYFNGNTKQHISTSLDIFHKILEYTPMPNMRMEEEDEYKSIILVDKKHYAYADFEGKIKTKGLSETRKDRIGLCRDMTNLVAKQLLLRDNIEDARLYLIRALNACFNATLEGRLDIYSISKEVRFEGNSCYRFTDIQGNEQNIPVAKVDKTGYVQYDINKVLSILEKDMNRLCVPAGIGTVRNLLADADF